MEGSRENKRAKLVEVALVVLRRQGIRKTTLNDIAEAAGIAPTSIYYYFANKNELLRAVLRSLTQDCLQEVRAVVKSSIAPEKKLTESWKLLFSTAQRSGLMVNLHAEVKPEVLRIGDDIIKDFSAQYEGAIRKILREGQKLRRFQIEDLDLTVTFLSGSVIGLLITFAGESQFELFGQRIEKLGNLIMKGLQTR